MAKLAIIGLGCLFPGGKTPEQFYQSLVAQKPLIADEVDFAVSAEQFEVPVDTDALKALDECFLYTQYILHEALKSAGYLHKPEVLARTGMIMGSRESFSEEIFNLFSPAYYAELENCIRELIGDDRFEFDRSMLEKTGSPLNIFNFSYPTLYAARNFKIKGPAFAFDGACASSLYSIRLAAAYLESGKADMMVAGGLFFGLRNKALPAYFESLDVTAKPGSCKPLDRYSGGMIPNEGGGAVVLKRLQDAQRDGDPILAVVEGVGWSNSGRGKQILAPSLQGQLLAYQNAFSTELEHQLQPTDIDYIECHATGTKVGDAVELESLEQYYRAACSQAGVSRKPLFGAVKGNIGHLLTASGMASLIKVIYSMKSGLIPGCYGVSEPMASPNGFFAADNLVLGNMPWPQQQASKDPKRAAISAFGFGGSNAHLLLSEYLPGLTVAEAASIPQPSATSALVVGMGAQIGNLEGVKAVSDALYYGKSPSARATSKRFRGMDRNEQVHANFAPADTFGANYYFSRFDFDFVRNSVLPSEESEAVNKELMLLKVASEALEDAGFERGAASRNVAVIVAAKQNLFQLQLGLNVYLQELISGSLRHSGIQLDEAKTSKLIKIARDAVMSPRTGFDLLAACIGPIIANRISSVWNFTGPSIKLCALEHSFTEGLTLAQLLLDAGSVEAVVLAAIDADPVLESRIWHQKYGIHYGLKADGAAFGESAVAFVLKPAHAATQQPVYAELTVAATEQLDAGVDEQQAFSEFYQRSLALAQVKPAEVSYLECVGDLSRRVLTAPLTALNQLSVEAPQEVGAAALNFGQTLQAAEANSVLKAILMLTASFKPRALKKPAYPLPEWQLENLELHNTTRYWLDVDGPRQVSVLNAGFNRSFSHVLVKQVATAATPDTQKSVFQKQDFFFVIAAADLAGMQQALREFAKRMRDHSDLLELKFELLRAAQTEAALHAVITGSSAAQVAEELAQLQAALDAADATLVWSGKRGSYFAATPLAATGGVCLCYPPSGLNSPHAVYELISSVPEINAFLAENLQHTPAAIKQVLAQLDQHQKSKHELPIYMDGLVGALCTELLLKVIGLQPNAFVGLSFGELVMNSVTQVYSEAEGANFILDLVAPYIGRLSDPAFLKKYYNDPNLQWMSYFCKGSRERIAQLVELLNNQDEVYLTIYGSPTNLVISGPRDACEHAATQAGCLAYPISENIFVHTPPAMAFYDEIVATNLQHPYWINPAKSATYYKTYDQTPFNYSKEDFATNVANCICRPVNFQRVLQRAYADGARLFIGMDGGDLCESWVRENLDGLPAAVFSIKQRDLSLKQSLYSLCARLISHGVKLDLPRLLGADEQALTPVETIASGKVKKMRSMVRTISNEPATLREVILREENLRLFQPSGLGSAFTAKTETPALVATRSLASAAPPAFASAAVASAPVMRAASFPETASAVAAQLNLPDAEPLTTGVSADCKQPPVNQQWPVNNAAKLFKRVLDQNLNLHQRYLETQLNFSRLLASSLEQGVAFQPFAAAVNSQAEVSPIGFSGSPASVVKAQHRRPVIWDQATLRELTLGKLAPIWGADYAPVDNYPIRARLPAPPFMFVSRVMGLNAKFGELKAGASIETEYDVPRDAWYLCRGFVPVSVATESSHSGILLLSYIGVDVMFAGRLRFRAVDSTFTPHVSRFLRAGETCRGVFRIDSIVKNKNAVLVFYTYELYDAADVHLFTVKGLGGLFSEAELEKAQNAKSPLNAATAKVTNTERKLVQLPLTTSKTAFSASDLEAIQRGRDDLCFGTGYPAWRDGEQLYPQGFRVLTRVPQLDLHGGEFGLGYLVGEADIDPAHWVFDCHFPNDPVLPATFSVEGVVQLFVFFFHAAGLKSVIGATATGAMLPGVTSSLSFRGEIKRKPATIRYELTITDIRLGSDVALVGNVLIYNGDKLLTVVKQMGIKLMSEASFAIAHVE